MHLRADVIRERTRERAAPADCNSISATGVTVNMQFLRVTQCPFKHIKISCHKLFHQSHPAGPVGDSLVQLFVVPDSSCTGPLFSRLLGSLQLILPLFRCAAFHAHPGQVSREHLMGCVTHAAVDNAPVRFLSVRERERRQTCDEVK